MHTPEQIIEAERIYRLHYGIPFRPLEQAVGSNYHTLAEELALVRAGVHTRRARRSRNEAAHKLH